MVTSLRRGRGTGAAPRRCRSQGLGLAPQAQAQAKPQAQAQAQAQTQAHIQASPPVVAAGDPAQTAQPSQQMPPTPTPPPRPTPTPTTMTMTRTRTTTMTRTMTRTVTTTRAHQTCTWSKPSWPTSSSRRRASPGTPTCSFSGLDTRTRSRLGTAPTHLSGWRCLRPTWTSTQTWPRCLGGRVCWLGQGLGLGLGLKGVG